MGFPFLGPLLKVQEDGYYEVQATLRLADAAEVPEADDNDFKEKVARLLQSVSPSKSTKDPCSELQGA